jgi:hypothetical protein
MTQWRDKLDEAGQQRASQERKLAQERRDSERAERMRADNRMLLARRLINTSPEATAPRGRDPINSQARRLMQKPPEWAKPPPPTRLEIKRDALVAEKREHENALIKINKTLRNTMPFAKYREFAGARDRHVRAITKIENELHRLFDKQTNKQQKGLTVKAEMESIPYKEDGDSIMLGDTMVKGHRVGGQLLFNIEELRDVVLCWARELPKKTEDSIMPKAQDARRAITELIDGLGADIGNFRSSTKAFIEEIRQIRMTIVTETSQMTRGLREVRQFFLGSDYKDEIARLREFVDLCERLTVLKQNGTLDAITDTMLRLAIRE